MRPFSHAFSHPIQHRSVHAALASAMAVLLALSLSACNKPADSNPSPQAATSVGNDIDDTVVTTRVKSALMADPKINSYDFKVETRKGEVLLSGFVDSQDQLDLALRTTRGIDGVRSIQNKVALKGAAATVGNKVDDGLITGRVKAALLTDSSIQSRDIAVVTRIDAVQLSGFVNNQQQMDKAVGIASAVQGVRSVANEMQIKK
jgi:hyperosmotically inducible protein